MQVLQKKSIKQLHVYEKDISSDGQTNEQSGYTIISPIPPGKQYHDTS